jgi:hypothetical protein
VTWLATILSALTAAAAFVWAFATALVVLGWLIGTDGVRLSDALLCAVWTLITATIARWLYRRGHVQIRRTP